MHKIEYQDLKALGASDSALWVYNNTDPCEIYHDDFAWTYHVNIAGDKRVCGTNKEMFDFLESYDLREEDPDENR